MASQRVRLAMCENRGIARAERADEKTEATLTAAPLLLLLRRAARAAPLRTASMDLNVVCVCVCVCVCLQD